MNEEFIPLPKTLVEPKDNDDIVASEQLAPALLTSTPAPWLAFSNQYEQRASPLIRLHNEILDCTEYIAPSLLEMKQREKTLAELGEVVRSLWPKSKIDVFGSQMTKILTPASDLDIVVMNVPENLSDPSAVYHELAEKLRNSSLVSYVEAVTNAKVPIVKMDHKESGISVDICINNDSGLRTGRLIRKYVRDYPPLRPLALILKLFLSQRKMNDTYHGGIGSFLLTMMIVSFLQMKQRTARLSRLDPSWNLGTLLLEFFQYYGVTFNYYSVGVSITEGGSLLQKRKRVVATTATNFNHRPNLLYLENPDSPDLDIGKNSFTMPKIRRAFEHAHQLLCAALVDGRVPSYLAYVVRPDDPILQDRPGPELGGQRSNADALK
mmetsp:Transcript_20506/g.34311  ORF Transcript_20506/g.34311 Transcript_20506/m.34311 type:complete len:380 (+) Transcript_20506:29-1168(+)